MHTLHEEVSGLVEAKNGSDWSSATFCAELTKKLGSAVGDRVLRCSPKGLGGHSMVIIQFYNVPKVKGRERGGAVAENNRAMITVEGFGRGEGEPSPKGKVKMEISVWSFARREPPMKRPRGKTAAPAKVLDTIVKVIKDVLKIEPYLG